MNHVALGGLSPSEWEHPTESFDNGVHASGPLVR